MAVYEEKESYAASRAGGIGGTDCAAILGLSPWKRPIDIYAGKIAPADQPELDKECLTWGTLLEPIVRQRYALVNKVRVTAPESLALDFPRSRPWNDSTLVIGREPWMLGAPDGWIKEYQTGLEVKCSSRKSEEWGEEGTDQVPAHYLVQAAWYMAVCEASAWNFAVLFSGNKLAQYRVVRDMELEKELIESASAFWHDHVLRKIPPPIDESESYGRYLARKFSLGNGKIIRDPSREIVSWAEKMKQADEDVKEATDRKNLANNQLRALIGDYDKAQTPVGSVGWVRPKERQVTDYQALANDLRQEVSSDTWDASIAAHTKPRQDGAYLRSWWKKSSAKAEFGEY